MLPGSPGAGGQKNSSRMEWVGECSSRMVGRRGVLQQDGGGVLQQDGGAEGSAPAGWGRVVLPRGGYPERSWSNSSGRSKGQGRGSGGWLTCSALGYPG